MTKMRFLLFFVTALCLICTSCNDEDNNLDFDFNSEVDSEFITRGLGDNIEEKQKILDIIKKYNLTPVHPSEYTRININKLSPVSSAEQLQTILDIVNIGNKQPSAVISENTITRIKTRSESGGQRVVEISGTNADGTASVYVDLDEPSVVNSTVHLGLMDAFLAYQHISGSAYREGNIIEFTAYGEGWVKLIFEGIELYKYSTTIDGYCNSDGTNGHLTSF